MTKPTTASAESSDRVQRPRRRRWLTVMLALLIFAGGAVVGAAGTVLVALERLEDTLHHPEVIPDRVTARLTRRLDLSPEQADTVRKILGERYEALHQIRRETYPRVAEELDLARREIAEVLSETQRDKWYDWFDAARGRFHPPPK